ncbi:hypothetical protein [Bacillus sp. 1P02SD]|uniref:hypothetical protein n=1 Tax=Bacillus sp. 1P02SD TaxID=3132264 RepID=UPI0039A2C860
MKKILVLFLLLSLIIGTATAYADSQIRTTFSNLHSNFRTNNIASVIGTQATRLQNIILEQQRALKMEAISEIEAFYLSVNGKVLEKIENYQQSSQAQLADAKHSLEKEINLRDYHKAPIQQELEQEIETIVAEVLGQ